MLEPYTNILKNGQLFTKDKSRVAQRHEPL